MAGFETILFDKEEHTGYITLNRPEALNVYNIRMRDELYEVLGAVRDDPDIQVLIVKGAGEKAFCAGADLSEFLTAPSPIIARKVRWERDLWGLFLSLPQPIIAALHGYVLGSGIEMALCCDLRIASSDARFGLPETKLGIIPAAGATQTMPRVIGRARALDMLLTGRWLNAQEAYSAGLVNTIVSKDRLIYTVEEIARRINASDRVAIRYAKQAIVRGASLPLSAALDLERKLAASVLASRC